VGDKAIQLDEAAISIPESREALAPSDLVLGVRPEHVRFDDNSRLRGGVIGAEYLGTTQIVSVELARGAVKARIAADRNVSIGETVGLALNGPRLSLFEKSSGRAIETRLFEGVGHG
jgi:multiple sugar transport system ATP-binding protein